MLFGLFSRSEVFFELLKKSAQNMAEGSRLLQVMVKDFRDPSNQAKAIKDIEHIGDSITRDIAIRLNKTFITPIDREDIHDLASALDDILDVTEEIAEYFVLYKVTKPTETSVMLAELLCRASAAVACGVDNLGRPHSVLMKCNEEIYRIEHEADRVSRDAISLLFEKETNPITVIKWKEIYEHFEACTDRCEDAANILECIALKHN